VSHDYGGGDRRIGRRRTILLPLLMMMMICGVNIIQCNNNKLFLPFLCYYFIITTMPHIIKNHTANILPIL
jgi:hypothetical protein